MKKTRKKEKMNTKTTVGNPSTSTASGAGQKKELYSPYRAKKGSPEQEHLIIQRLRRLAQRNQSNQS